MSETHWPLDDIARECDDEIALVGAQGSYTFSEYRRKTVDIATGLLETGLQPGQRVAVVASPSVDLPILLMACFRLGVIACPLNPGLPPANLRAQLEALRPRIVLLGEEACHENVGAAPTLPMSEILASAPAREELPAFHLSRPATILFTSGSCATPKAAVLTFANHYHSAIASNRNIRLAPGDRWLLSLPLYHVAGLGVLFRCLLSGAAVSVPEAGESLPEAIGRYGATHASLVTTQLYRLLQEDAGIAALQSLKAILLGGGPMPECLIRQGMALGLRLYTSYGLTETASQMAATRPGDSLEHLLSSGTPLTPKTLRISEQGEVLVQGQTLFAGYLSGEEVVLPLTDDGWFPTGDLGRLDDAGYLCITGRKDNQFICGGENIQPEEIEAHLRNLPGVADALVVPVEHAAMGHVPVAFVRIGGRENLDPAALTSLLARHLPNHKVPRVFLPWPEREGKDGLKTRRGVMARLAQEQLRAETG